MERVMPINKEQTSVKKEQGPGFYKANEAKSDLYYAQTAVHNKEYTLLASLSDTYQYPIDGWTWYENRSLAITAENIVEPSSK